MQIRPSIRLSEEENIKLDHLSRLLYFAPLNDRSYAEYVRLCNKAKRKAKPNY